MRRKQSREASTGVAPATAREGWGHTKPATIAAHAYRGKTREKKVREKGERAGKKNISSTFSLLLNHEILF
jgi:hypothetical protein